MKACKTLIAVAIGLTLTLSSAWAQQSQMVAHVPFDFVVQNTTLPAGEYNFSEAGNSLLSITSADGQQHMFVSINSVDSAVPKTETELVFHRYGDKYFLSELWTGGNVVGSSLPATKLEHELAQGDAASNMSILAQQQPAR